MGPSGGQTEAQAEPLARAAAKQRIGALLAEAGLVTQAQMDEVLAEQAKRGGEVVDILFARDYIDPKTLLDFLLSHPEASRADLSHLELSDELISAIPPELARKHRVVPIDRTRDLLVLAAEAPPNEAARQELESAAGCRIKTVLCARDDVVATVARYYPSGAAGAAPAEGLREPLRLGQVARLVRTISSLPALPETVMQVREATERPDSSIASVVHVITLDPPIAAKVLGVANSPAYGFRHRVHDLNLAVSLLGLKETYAVVLAAAVINLVSEFTSFDYRTFFLEAVCGATAARIVSKAAGHRQLDGVFSAGLLHDIGKAALWELAPHLFDKLDKGLKGKALIEEEKRILGISHAEAGYELAHHWNLPPEIAEAIRFHHDFESATDHKQHVAVVALADLLVDASGSALEENEAIFAEYGTPLAFLGIDPEIAEAMLDKYLKRHQRAVQEAFG